MANKQSAIKRIRSSRRKEKRNQIHRGRARTSVKNARKLIEQGQIEEAREAVQRAVRALDKAAAKGVIHENNAARKKSRLMRQLNEAAESAEAA